MIAFAAEDYGFSVYDSKNGIAVEGTGDNAADVLGDRTISYDAVTNTLTLNNAVLTSQEAPTPTICYHKQKVDIRVVFHVSPFILQLH